ncbi:MAG TPA: SPOR domain-containing protein [Chitinophagales bacterium]|nr:SPOR domain-containing protein [Chitinophagales bacterium]HRK28472.1 SPOR domain-containing protein [Chitinophagales bacterium]
MNRFYTTLVVMFIVLGQLFFVAMQAQTTAPTPTAIEPVYLKIQVAAYKNLQYARLDSLFAIGNVYDEDAGGGIHRIVLGYYTDAPTANRDLERVKKVGFPKAFITTYKGNLDPAICRPLNPQNVQPGNPATTQPANPAAVNQLPPAGLPAPPVASASNQTLKKTGYIIELGSFTNIAEVNLGKVTHLGELNVEENAGPAKIILGPFAERDVAESTLNIVKANGFPNATIKTIVSDKANNDKNRFQAQIVPNTDQQTTYHSNDQTSSGEQLRIGAPIGTALSTDDVVQLSHFFTEVKFASVKIPTYDPTYEPAPPTTNTNIPSEAVQIQSLYGGKLPKRFIYLFNNNQPTNLTYFALYRYAINPQYDGYVIRSGKGKYDQDNEINLFIFDKATRSFIDKRLISTAQGLPDGFKTVESWLMDLNADDVPDLLNYTIIEQVNPQNNQITKQSRFTAFVWVNNHFLKADVIDEPLLRQKLEITE